MRDQHTSQDAAMQQTKANVTERVTAQIRTVLRPKVDELVATKVGEYIEGRVRAQVRGSQKLYEGDVPDAQGHSSRPRYRST